MAKKIRGRNEGSIHQRSNGTWRVQIYLDGKRTGKTFKTKAEAQNWLQEMQYQLRRGFDLEGSQITLGEYLQQWLDAKSVSARETTIYQYRLQVKNHIIPYLGDVPLQDLHLARIERFYTELIASGVGVRTVRYVHGVLHRALEKAMQYDLVIRNPAHGAAQPKYAHKEMTVLDEYQVPQFLIAARGSSYEALYHVAIKTGMRQGEMFGLKWTDLQWQSGTLLVQRQIKRVPGSGWQFAEPKTNAGRRTIRLGEGTLQALRIHRERQERQKKGANGGWKEHGLIFPNSVGTPGDPSNLRKDFLRILQSAMLPKLRFHDLRHTAASLMLNNGVPPIVVSRILGHAKPSTTMDIYGHLLSNMQGEAARIMDELVTPIVIGMEEIVREDEKIGD
ncbi:MAG: site-specific integrase [Chloroflexi bacterium]|jgi:integrase|nr:site-specific integrase [Chloroflexota bacterium]